MTVYKKLSDLLKEFGLLNISEPDFDPASHEVFVRFLYSKFPCLLVPYLETGSLSKSFMWLASLQKQGVMHESFHLRSMLTEVQNAIKILVLSSKGKKYLHAITDIFDDLLEFEDGEVYLTDVTKERLQHYIEYHRRCLETLRDSTEEVLRTGSTEQIVKLLTALDSTLDSQFQMLTGFLKAVDTDYVRDLVS